MTANWKIVRATLAWLLVALVTLGIVIASPYATKSSAASYPTVTSCKGLTIKKTDGVWTTYRIKDGARVSYTGIAKNSNGWWRTVNGVVDFEANSIYKNDNGWYKTSKGKVTFKENSIYKNENGWYKCTNSKVTFKENGVFKNKYGWWYVKNSKVDRSFNGLASNENGLWFIRDGYVDFNKNGSYEYQGKLYLIKNGKATPVQKQDGIVEVIEAIDEYEPLSRAILTKVLVEEYGFSEEEAAAGINESGVNFYTNALFASAEILGDWDLNEYKGVSEDLYLKIMKDVLLFEDDEISYAHGIVKEEVQILANKGIDYWMTQCSTAAEEYKSTAGKNYNKANLTSYLTQLLFTKNQVNVTVTKFFPG